MSFKEEFSNTIIHRDSDGKFHPSPSPSIDNVGPRDSKNKSGVWQFFQRLAPELAECMLCTDPNAKKTYKLAKKSTSGMIAHLRAYHKEAYALAIDHKNLFGRRARQCALMMIETPSVSPSLFRSDSFLALFAEVEWPHFPTVTAVNTVILPDMLNEITAKNRADLSGIPVTLLVDSFTSVPISIRGSDGTRGGRRVTIILCLAYFVNASWEMESRLIAVRKSIEEQTPTQIRAVLEEVIRDARLDVVAVVSDGAANMRAAVAQMGIRHPRCTAHQLSLAVSRGVAAWSEGGEVLRRLREFARDLNEPTAGLLRALHFNMCSAHSLRPRTLPSAPSTRWGGDYRLIEAALEQMSAVNNTLESMDMARFSDEDIALLTDAAAVFKPFARLGLVLSQEGRLLSESFFVVRKLEKHLDTCASASSSPSSRSLALSILPHFSSFAPRLFSSFSSLTSVFFDPCALFHFKADVNWRDVAAGISPSLSRRPSSSVSTPTPQLCLSSRRAALYGDDDDAPPVKMIKEETVSSGIDAELLLYLDQSLNGVDVSLEALDFWKTNQDKFPILSPLARRFLSSPPTAIDAEKVLSAAGLLCSSTLDNLLTYGNTDQICMLRFYQYMTDSMRVLSHSRDRTIVTADIAKTLPEEVVEVPEADVERDMEWEEEAPEGEEEPEVRKPVKGLAPLFSSDDIKEEPLDFPSPS